MKRESILPIAAFLMLAAPCLNAGLDSWISSILPEKMRASETMRSSIYTAKEHLKIKKPVFVMHEAFEDNTLAEAKNYLPFSIIAVNSNALAQENIERQKRTGYHEVGHVLYNHYVVNNTLEKISNPLYLFGLLAFGYGAIKRHTLTPSRQYRILATSTVSLLGSSAHNFTSAYSESTARKQELQADAVAFSVMRDLDGSAPLEKKLALSEQIANMYGLDFRNRSVVHPTIGEEIAIIRAVLDKKLKL